MRIVFTPDWFLGTDILIEGFSFLILLAFFVLSMKSYKLSKNKNTRNLGIAFLLIAVAEIATILTKFVLYYDTTFISNMGKMVMTYHVLRSVDTLYYVGFFIHKLLTLTGLYLIYKIPLKKEYSGDFLLVLFFIIISALFSNAFYYLFHLTALILLLLIINNYSKIYRKNKSTNTGILIGAFSMLALSQIIFIMSPIGLMYAIAQTIQLVSYIALLIIIIRILQNGQEKKQK